MTTDKESHRALYSGDYLGDVAFEAFVLENCVPLFDSRQGGSAELDLSTNKFYVNISSSEQVGRTKRQVIEEVGIRPLLFGSAWKCLDVLFEYALEAAGLSPANGRRWLIAEKIGHARAGAGIADPLSRRDQVWERVAATYVSLSDIRNCLTHRRAVLEPNGDLVATDQLGGALTPLSREQQDSLARVVQRVRAALQTGRLDSRDETALLADLDLLAPHTGLPLTGHPLVRHPASRMRVLVAHGQDVDLTAIKARLRPVFVSAPFLDIEFVCDGHEYVVDIDEVPDGHVVFEPESLAWL